MNNKSQIFFGVSLSIFLVLSILILWPFLITVSLALIAAITLHPAYKKITKVLFGNKSLGAIVTILLFYIIIFIPVFFVSAELFKEARALYVSMDTPNTSDLVVINKSINNTLSQIIPNANLRIDKYAGEFSSWLISNLGNFFSGTFDIFLKILLATVSLFFLLKDGDKFKKSLRDLIPLQEGVYNNLANSIEVSVKSVVFGSIIIAIVQGFVSGVGMAIFGVPNATLLGALSVIAAFIPGVGTGIIFIPVLVYSFFYGTLFNTTALLIWAVVVVGMIDNLLRPLIMHKSVGVHPLFVLFSVLGGITLIGPSGFILGPLILSLLLALVRAYKEKGLSV